MEAAFIHFITLWRPLGYSLVFLGTMFEGDMFLVTTAALARFGYFDVFDMLFITYAGVLTGDILWFYTGGKLSDSDNRFVHWVKRHTKHLTIDSKVHPLIALIVSKFMYGTHHAYLFSLGASGFSIARYIRLELVAAAVWLFIVGGAGYAFGALLQNLKHTVKSVELILLFVVVVYFSVTYLLTRRNKTA